MAELITVPSFIFYQDGDLPIQVNYYNGSIELTQDDSSVLIDPDHLEKLFKEIKKHKAEAQQFLDKR